MLPLHKITGSLAFMLLSSSVFVSCVSKSKKETEIIKALNESIVNSNLIIEASSKEILVAFEEKLRDAGSSERAKIWFPKAKQTQQFTDQLYNFINQLKKGRSLNVELSSELYEKLVKYKENILSIDSEINQQFETSLGFFTETINTSASNQKEIFQNYFKNASTISMIAMLNKLQNNIKVIENKFVMFCYERVGNIRIGPCSPDLPIAVQSSTVVQPGEKMEITTGICSFYSRIKPEVFVYEKPVAIGSAGVAVSKFKAESRPGKYYVPVKVKYTDQDGKQQIVQKEIEYTVANIQKQ